MTMNTAKNKINLSRAVRHFGLGHAGMPKSNNFYFNVKGKSRSLSAHKVQNHNGFGRGGS